MVIRLEVVTGTLAGQTFEFAEADTFILGRGEQAHGRLLGDPGVSRLHCLIEFHPQTVPPAARLRDMGSTNGVRVNGQRYGGREDGAVMEVDLRDGDVVRISESALVVHMRPPEPAMRPTGFADIINDALGPRQHLGPPDIPGYEIGAKVGQGNSGVVYRARRKVDGREVAVKLLRASGDGDQAMEWDRFAREIAVTRQVRHENIVEFIDAGPLPVGLFMALEFLSGGTLQELLKAAPKGLPPETAFPIMEQMLAGIALAHQFGVVHRDIKPGNVLFQLRPDGRRVAKISDLGLAKHCQQAGVSDFTATGSGGGTPAYMAPEQITQFRHAKPAADVFSLSATFYEMLCGEVIYNFRRGKDYFTTILEGDIIPLARRETTLPVEWIRLIDTGLAFDPVRRFDDAGAMLEEFRRIPKPY